MRFLRAGFVVVLALLATLPAAAIVRQAEPLKQSIVRVQPGVSRRVVPIDAGGPTALAASAREFQSRYGGEWSYRADRRTGLAHLVQGSGIPLIPGRGNDLEADARPTLDSVEPLVRAFVAAAAELIVPERGLLVIDRDTSSIRDDGRLISVYYHWVVDGVPVEEARVFVRINSGNITQFGAPLVGPLAVDTSPALDEEAAWRSLMEYTGDQEVHLRRDAKLLLQPEDGPAGSISYRLIWKLTYRIFERLETWEGRVDARSGEVVGFGDTNMYAGHVVGGVYPRTVFENNETRAPMPFAEVWIDHVNAIADVGGAFPYSGGELFAGLSGVWNRANCTACSGPTQPIVRAPVGSGFVDFGFGGLDEIGNGASTPADRNTVFHLTQVQRMARKWLPAVPFFNRTHFTSNTNIQSTCNAVFSGDAINMFRSGGGCNNTGEVADVIYHEYGHGMDIFTRAGDGATGEASGDIVSTHMTHSALIGPGFGTNGSPVRNIDQFTTSKGLLTVGNIASKCSTGGTPGPLGFEVHCEGQIYGQTSWDLSQALVAKYGQFTGWRSSERVFHLALPDSGSYLPGGSFPIYDAYINADDDDGNLVNGTPNGQEIFDAFDLHGIAGAPQTNSPACARPVQPTLTVTPSCDLFDLSWTAEPGVDRYELFRSELREDMAQFPLGQLPAATTSFVDSQVVPGVDYWYTVMTVDAAGCESEIEGRIPARLTAQPILTVTSAVVDDEPRGNRSGFADPGEDVDVVVTLANLGEIGGTSISGTVVPVTAGVTMLEDVSTWSALAVGGSAQNSDPIRFQTDEAQVACGDEVRLRFDPDDGSGCASQDSFLDVRLGQRVVLHQDDFESNLGWAQDLVNSTGSDGTWTRADPAPSDYQTGEDHTPNGAECWFTGAGGDVDGGEQILVSPLFDLSGETRVEYSYFRWFALRDPGTDAGDFFAAEVSDNGGTDWTVLETLDSTQAAAFWVEARFRLEEFISLTDQVVFRFRASDGPASGTLVEAAIDDILLERFECDLTPACFVEPTFTGLESVAPGSSCGEVELTWSAATSNCANAAISYNVYRSTDPGFDPDTTAPIFSGLSSPGLTDVLLDPTETFHYVVRAFDSRSGEDANVARFSVVPTATPDVGPPIFGGLESAAPGSICGETVLSWSPGLESCSGPVTYDIHRSTNPGFTPGPDTFVGTTLSLSFTDLDPLAGTNQTYVVRARDALGNEDPNLVRLSTTAALLDRDVFATPFETSDANWSVTPPDFATAGNWQWGNPFGTAYQPEDDASPAPGERCWITGLAPSPGNGDVDNGVTTLLSAQYDLATAVSPAVRYQRWFTNDRGGFPGEATDDFIVEVSNSDGASWTELERVGAGTPLEWIPVELPLPVAGSSQMRFRFTAADLGEGSLVEAGIDEFELVDKGQGCAANLCGLNPDNSCAITSVQKSGSDVVLSWSAFPQQGRRTNVYKVSGCGEAIQIGSTDAASFVHENGLLSPEDFSYRITYVADCGEETPLDACVEISCD